MPKRRRLPSNAGSSRRKRRRFTARAAGPVMKRIPRMPVSSGMPSVLRTKMRYCEEILLGATSGGAVGHLFSCNSIHDPNFSGVGHQPYGHDEFSNFYTYYTVRRAWITVHAHVGGTTAPTTVVVQRTDSTSGTVSPLTRYCEAPGSTFGTLSGKEGSPTGLTLKQSFDLGRDTGDRDDDSYKGAFGASPSDQMYFRIGAQPIDGTSNISIPVLVTITYDVELSVRKTLSES